MKSHLEKCPTAMPEKVVDYCQKCEEGPGGNPYHMIVTLLQDMCNKLKCDDHVVEEEIAIAPGTDMPSTPTSEIFFGNDYLARTRRLGVALFWQTIQKILEAEEVRIKRNVFTNLLHNRGFHKALFACSVECMLKAHTLMSHLFPRTMHDFELSAEDIGKVIESFLLNASLPVMLLNHMEYVKGSIFFQWIWKEDSFLISLFKKKEEGAAVAAGDVKPVEGSSSSSNASNKTTVANVRSDKMIDMFQKCTFKLASDRTGHICKRVNLGKDVFDKIHQIIYEVIYKHAFVLLKNRNVDVAILCSIYGVCRAQKLNVTFELLINSFQKCSQQSCVTHIVRGIELTQKGKEGPIVDYYNEVFVSRMKNLILEQCHGSSNPAEASHVSFNNATSMVQVQVRVCGLCHDKTL